jgi:rubrerythrin
MDWNSPKGVLRRGMSLERDGYKFYMEAAERSSDEHGAAMFRDLANQEVDHLKLLLVEYRALDAGEGWVPYREAMDQSLEIDPTEPDLPGQEPPEEYQLPVFTSEREVSLEGDIAALDFGLKTEDITRDLYAQGAKQTDDERAREAYEFLVKQEEHHYELLDSTRNYLAENQTWWDSEEYPFFIG